MGRPSITLYVDTVSPFAYIAYHILRHDTAFKDVDITYVPIFLGGVMKACGNQPPINIKNKADFVNVDRTRWATAFGVPMAADMPAGFPALTVSIMRALCALDAAAGQDKLCAALDALFPAYFVDLQQTQAPEALAAVLAKAVGGELAEKALAAAPKEGKTLLLENTDKAFKTGAFGLPWLMCTNAEGKTEGFWGVDHLGQVSQFLGIEKPQAGGWKAML